jgi:signal transduction histidine kinase
MAEAVRSQTIRGAVLRGALLLALVAILLSGTLSFLEFRSALQAEIARNLGDSAAALQARIDSFLSERFEDMREWHRLELLQDIRVGDVDLRLARLLSDFKRGHGDIYRALYCTDRQGRIVAASEPGLTGHSRPPGSALRGGSSGATPEVVFERVGDAGHAVYALRADVADDFGGGRLGYLYAELNWEALLRFLRDDVAASARSALLLDADERVIAAAGELAPPAAAAPRLSGWTGGGGGPHGEIRPGAPLAADRLLVGAAASAGYQQFAGFGWHTLVVESTSVAFAPVWRLTWAMLAGLAFTLLVAGWLTMRLSARIAAPLVRLTEFARHFRQARGGPPPKVETGISEVGELGQAFAEMIQALEESREQLIRAGKLAVVGEMAAIMAHEVRTPLGILKTSAQLLERQPGLSEQGRELTGFIVSETERLNRLVTTLLECASPRPPQFQPHDTHELLRHVLSLVAAKAEKRGVTLETRLEAGDALLECDREQLIQVFLNLIINAIQHVPEAGQIVVSSANRGTELVFRVEDDGPGFASEDAGKLFDPFYTRREGGVGLGLTIVQQIVQAHAGEIVAGRSALGGACFTLNFATRPPQGEPH